MSIATSSTLYTIIGHAQRKHPRSPVVGTLVAFSVAMVAVAVEWFFADGGRGFVFLLSAVAIFCFGIAQTIGYFAVSNEAGTPLVVHGDRFQFCPSNSGPGKEYPLEDCRWSDEVAADGSLRIRTCINGSADIVWLIPADAETVMPVLERIQRAKKPSVVNRSLIDSCLSRVYFPVAITALLIAMLEIVSGLVNVQVKHLDSAAYTALIVGFAASVVGPAIEQLWEFDSTRLAGERYLLCCFGSVFCFFIFFVADWLRGNLRVAADWNAVLLNAAFAVLSIGLCRAMLFAIPKIVRDRAIAVDASTGA